uniref:Uncharacterized protein n=1 Tax=viral metagenome TaxID=1070528 RepID=A0A6C0I6E7_9ZZZZ
MASFGSNSFFGTGLVSIKIPDTYTSIEPGAFAGCSNLVSVTIGNGITDVSAGVFSDSPIQTVVLGANVTYYDPSAFPSTVDNFSFPGDATNPDVINALAMILNTVSATNLIFTNPAMTVTAITDAATELNIELTLPPISELTYSGTVVTGYTGTIAGPLIIPEGITEIADNAFQETAITSLKLPSTLEIVGNFAFDQCASLTDIDLGGTVTIGECAFRYCIAKTIVIPDSVTSMGISVFFQCINLTEVTIGSGLTELASNIFLYSDNLKKVTFSPSSQLTTIGNSAFEQTGIIEIVIPPSVTSIGTNCFTNCFNLFSVTLPPSGLTSIPTSAFLNCSTLKRVKLGSGIQTIGDNAFNACSSLAGFIHPDGSVQITVPASVTTIGQSAFAECGFKQFTIPSTVTTLGDYIFYYCGVLESVTLEITQIPYGIFAGCSALKNVIFKEDIISIGQSAFESCASLTTFVFPPTLQFLPWFAFSGAGLTSITLPNSLTVMNPSVFANCASLTDINFGTGLTEITDGTFAECTALSNVTLPSVITSILAFGFADCTSLTDISMTEVTQVGAYGFYGCTSLTDISMPKVTTIGNYIFQNCTSLTNVSMPKTTAVSSVAFENCTSLVTIDMPEVMTIANNAFVNCSSLTNVSMPKTTYVGGNGFENCTSLVTIDMPEVTYVDQQAFKGCTSLSSVTFSPSMTNIAAVYQFVGCTSLTTLPTNYPNSGKNIDTMLRVFGYPGIFTSTFTENTLYTDLSSTSNALTITVGIDPVPSAEGTLCDVTITLSTSKQGVINFFGRDFNNYLPTNTPIDGITATAQFAVYGEWNYMALFSGGGEQSYTLFTA